MGGKRKRVESPSCVEWRKKIEVLDILRHGNFTDYMERLKGNNPAIRHQFVKSWKDGSVMVGNQRLEVMEDTIAEATGLALDEMNFYRDQKISDKAIDDFVESEQERNRLVKIGNSYFNLASISRPWWFVFFAIMEYLMLDGTYTNLYGYHFVLATHFHHNIRVNFSSYLLQSLSNSTLAIQHDPIGEHACHEGLMVLVMNVLKSKKIPKPRNIKGEDQDIEGSFQETGYDSETQDEMEEGLVSTKKGSVGSSNKKK